ncbi:MAG TPA: hypothetical protein VF540_07000 [Segetibacter sp.]
MSHSNESFKEQRTKLKRLLIIYSKIQYNESKLFNLLGKEIENIIENNQHSEKRKRIVDSFLQKFNYPRELVIEPLSKTLQVEQFTLTDWRHYCFINGADEKN